MKIYLIGGAVRDKLLGLPISDKDYVVVGATEAEMERNGFIKVGKDFPVYLHPQTKEEYALARTERKNGHGYHGFSTHSLPETTLEQDLLRRDLTINAIALDDKGQYIDPFGGKDDIQRRILRHVSEAFSEDPLRIIRLARFQTTLAAFEFKIAPETTILVSQLVESQELKFLAKERIWQEFVKVLNSNGNPYHFLSTLKDMDALLQIAPILDENFSCFNPMLTAQANYHDLDLIAKSTLFFAQLPLKAILNLSQDLPLPAKISKNIIKFYYLTQFKHDNNPDSYLILLRKTDALRQTKTFEQLLQLFALHPNATADRIKSLQNIVGSLKHYDYKKALKGISPINIKSTIEQIQLTIINSIIG